MWQVRHLEKKCAQLQEVARLAGDGAPPAVDPTWRQHQAEAAQREADEAVARVRQDCDRRLAMVQDANKQQVSQGLWWWGAIPVLYSCSTL